MIRRALIVIFAILAISYVVNNAARAAELAMPRVGEIAAGLSEADRARAGATLRRENIVLVGEVRRKGQLIIATGLQHGVSWRLVIESATGEIIGRRPLAEAISFPR